jgi:acetyl esterase/lipase
MSRLHRRAAFVLSGLLAGAGAWGAEDPKRPATEPSQAIPLWPGGAPGALGTEPKDIPAITVFPAPAEKASGAAVVVCPGGAYGYLAPYEGWPVAEWLNSLGVTGFVLSYRLGPRYHHPAPLQDAQRAIRTARARASEWKLNPERIGILGFSAGGHLASTAATHFDGGNPDAADPVERLSSRPDFAILIYPVITMADPFTHKGSRKNLLGEEPKAELIDLLSNEKQVTAETPPTFIVFGANDKVVPVENGLMFASALSKAKAPFELHVYERGPHGFGLGVKDPVLVTWPDRCAAWLGVRGVLAR